MVNIGDVVYFISKFGPQQGLVIRTFGKYFRVQYRYSSLQKEWKHEKYLLTEEQYTAIMESSVY